MSELTLPRRGRPVAWARWAITAALLLLLLAAWPGARVALADEGWVINSFQANVRIGADGALQVEETIQVDFGGQQKHGIFRDIPIVYEFGDDLNRVYDLRVASVTDANGRAWPYETDREGSYLRLKIGDPDRTISGPQTYRLAYTVQGALNGFPDHDELYWNVNGPWPARSQRVQATVTLPAGGVREVECFQGAVGSRESCQSSSSANSATFTSTRALPEGEQLTVVVGFAKGLVPEPAPRLEQQPRELLEYFEVNPSTLGGGLLVLVLGFGGTLAAWWRFGRDRRYSTIYYLTDNPSEETLPVMAENPIVVEYMPPDDLRPAQLGLLLDETADTLDVTATAVDLAVRGYLRIAEVQSGGILGGLFSKRDWELTRTDKGADDLLPYERTVLDGLFSQGSPVRLSELKRKFYTHLQSAKSQLYQDAMARRWFVVRPDWARGLWALGGILIIVLGLGAMFALGRLYGAALMAAPLLLVGALVLGFSHNMPKRTARGSEALRRTLGFRQYVATAETDRQRFNEATNLFAEYLPYAIVFHCVDKWARAFEGLDTQAATQSWYVGSGSFAAMQFSHDLQDFSSTVSSTIVSTPGGSGGSGLGGGGFSGGGGGGGGGGSW
ncbi:MAG: DUF2207 domain-containing protein [Chloroflexota bacterium]